jgi:hypothetical protein
MANFTRLRDLYAFPGLDPVATIRGVFGDPYAVVISVRRRRKKHAVACAASAIAPSTIKPQGASVTSIAEAGASTWNSPSGAFSVGSAKP